MIGETTGRRARNHLSEMGIFAKKMGPERLFRAAGGLS
ncbi:hypothetical protein SAMN05421757_105335 [Tropicimonas sediminicola]|uniref:Uncharacterized protein n=1 Tax=Tropicimonas sediminicola TaxID=1031541 RepID=A0A239JKS7_9RHOB|nr:hypothetical protein SAMN05421757_105335 [Tropicimonas sediminicola]